MHEVTDTDIQSAIAVAVEKVNSAHAETEEDCFFSVACTLEDAHKQTEEHILVLMKSKGKAQKKKNNLCLLL